MNKQTRGSCIGSSPMGSPPTHHVCTLHHRHVAISSHMLELSAQLRRGLVSWLHRNYSFWGELAFCHDLRLLGHTQGLRPRVIVLAGILPSWRHSTHKPLRLVPSSSRARRPCQAMCGFPALLVSELLDRGSLCFGLRQWVRFCVEEFQDTCHGSGQVR